MPTPPNYDDPRQVLQMLRPQREYYGCHLSPYAGTNCPDCCCRINLPRGVFYDCPCNPGVILGNSLDDAPPWHAPDYGPTLAQIENALRWERESN